MHVAELLHSQSQERPVSRQISCKSRLTQQLVN